MGEVRGLSGGTMDDVDMYILGRVNKTLNSVHTTRGRWMIFKDQRRDAYG